MLIVAVIELLYYRRLFLECFSALFSVLVLCLNRTSVISDKKKRNIWVNFDLTNLGKGVIIYLLSDRERKCSERNKKSFEKVLDKSER